MALTQKTSDWTGEIVVVDPRPSDYASLAEHAKQMQLRLNFLEDGRPALHCLDASPTALWLMNLELPDFDGFELLEMLVTECRDATVLAIANSYDPDDEIRALYLGAAMYLCKPAQPSWLVGWQKAMTPIIPLESRHLEVKGLVS